MPLNGFFGTNNPTPWMNPGGNIPGAQGNKPQTLGQPAGDPAAPALAPPQAPPQTLPQTQATPPPSAPPQQEHDGWWFGDPTPGVGTNRDGPPVGDGGTTPPAQPTLPDSLVQLLGQMFGGGAQSPFTAEMMNFLPGRSAGGEAAQSVLLNALFNQFLQQGPRSQQAEGIYGDVFNAGINSPSYGLSQDASRMARQRIRPGALDAYEQQLRTQAASDAGQGYQNSMQRLRDAGMFGRGGVGVDPTLAASNLANANLQRANTDISGIMESLTQNRLGQAGDLSRSGADVFQNLGMIPAYNYANKLSTQQNAALAPFLEQLNMLSQMAITGDVANRNQPSAFESIGVPIIGGALSGASGIADLLKAL